MSGGGVVLLLAMVALLLLTAPLLGSYMAKVYGSDKAPGDRVFLPVERLVYRLFGIDHRREQRWSSYAMAVL